MKSINEFCRMSDSDKNKLKMDYVDALSNKDFNNYIKLLNIEDELLMKYTSRLEDSHQEFKNCTDCPGLKACQNSVKGYLLKPNKNGKTLEFYYQACRYKQKDLKENEYKENVFVFDLPKHLREASLKNVYTDDKNRMELVKYVTTFVREYSSERDDLKGLYLHGSFGSGKSYVVAALFNELAKRGVSSSMVYYPEFLRKLKESFGTDYKERFESIKKTPLLLLDDIGAENLTAWSRDEVLGPILQYRMDEGLPTFFTSNLTLEELELHLSMSNNGVEKVKARRIIERIKQLTIELKLATLNRRK